MSYISDKGHTLIDRRLYLPRSWAEDQSKRKKTAIPEAIKFATKPLASATDVVISLQQWNMSCLVRS